MDTLEMKWIPRMFIEDPEEYEMVTGATEDDMETAHTSWEDCIEFEPPDSRESFRFMESFVNTIPDEKLQLKLVHALNNRKPFANFKHLVENSRYREAWFEFKKKKLEEFTFDIIEAKLMNEEYGTP
jgi:hypothetical protein